MQLKSHPILAVLKGKKKKKKSVILNSLDVNELLQSYPYVRKIKMMIDHRKGKHKEIDHGKRIDNIGKIGRKGDANNKI